MGDRISFQFVNGNEKSVVFFSHWAGEGVFDMLKDFNKDMREHLKKGDGISYPLTRMEPQTVMVNFIEWLGREERDFTDGDYYLGFTENDGDNSDNGHWLVKLGRTGIAKIVSAHSPKTVYEFEQED